MVSTIAMFGGLGLPEILIILLVLILLVVPILLVLRFISKSARKK